MSEEKSKTKFESIIDEITKDASELILSWTKQSAGDITNWFSLMESLVEIIENKYGRTIKGVEKANIATKAIITVAQSLWDKYTSDLSDEEKDHLRNGDLKILSIIMDNPSILKASTSFLKKLLDHIDKDGDGEITADECKMFWCCGNVNACSKNKDK